jgi:hypothetical protein
VEALLKKKIGQEILMRGIFLLESLRKSSLKKKKQTNWKHANNGYNGSTIESIVNIGVVKLARSWPVHLLGG